MFRVFSWLDWPLFWRLSAVLTIALTVAGCTNLNLRGDGFAKNETFDGVRQYHSNDDRVDLFGFSNKARQIERNCGAH